MSAEASTVVVSNRGPLAFTTDDDGGLVTKRAGGGLVSALGPGVLDAGATWVAGAISEADVLAASSEKGRIDAEGFSVLLLPVDRRLYRAYYDVVANATLWYLHHGLFDPVRRPRIDRRWNEAWAAFRSVNDAFADAVIDTAPDGAAVLVQDYHLSLLGTRLAKERPDLRTAHFHHTPFAEPQSMHMLPRDVVEELLSGLAAHGACGFHTRRWADAFTACCEDVLGETPRTFVSPAAPDLDDIMGVAASDATAAAARELDEIVGDRKLIVRVDRIELSKNLLRGFHAFEDLLETRPEWRERVVFAALVYPSRQSLADYLAYRSEVEGLIDRINARWSTDSWTPIVMDSNDDFPRSVAALQRYDALLVNPVRDGLNLVAKEGALLNERDGVLVLSRESGVWDELGEWSLGINPFDEAATSDALHAALTMSGDERRERAQALKEAAARRAGTDFFADQLAQAQRS